MCLSLSPSRFWPSRTTSAKRPISPPSDKPTNIIAYQIAFDAWVAGDRKAMKEYLRHYRIPPIVNTPIHRGHAERPANVGKPTAGRLNRAGRG